MYQKTQVVVGRDSIGALEWELDGYLVVAWKVNETRSHARTSWRLALRTDKGGEEGGVLDQAQQTEHDGWLRQCCEPQLPFGARELRQSNRMQQYCGRKSTTFSKARHSFSGLVE